MKQFLASGYGAVTMSQMPGNVPAVSNHIVSFWFVLPSRC
jgi:hypothetical protein